MVCGVLDFKHLRLNQRAVSGRARSIMLSWASSKSFPASSHERRWFPIGMWMKWDLAGPSPSVLPAVGAYSNDTRAEAASAIAETCRTIPIALNECK